MPVTHHHPSHLPPSLNYGAFAKELAQAQYAIGLLQGAQGRLNNAMHLIGPLVAKEAAVSSKIEGTQSTSSDIYLFDAGGKPTYSDTPVVSNYRAAMLDAIEGVERGRKLAPSMLKSLHRLLLQNVRHKGKLGDFRDDKVWIAEKDGDPIEKALYIPPEHIHIDSYIDNLLEYIETDTADLNLVKAGVVHYQFEAVHPFEDGNGRIGRLLIPLILYYKGDLSLPIVYSSGYFESRPTEYRLALRNTDKSGQFEDWLKFFFNAISEQAKETMQLIENIESLHQEIKKKYELNKSPFMSRFIEFLFEFPIFSMPMMQKKLTLSRLTAVRLVTKLQEDKIIQELTGQRGQGGAKLYVFNNLLKIIR